MLRRLLVSFGAGVTRKTFCKSFVAHEVALRGAATLAHWHANCFVIPAASVQGGAVMAVCMLQSPRR